jgi:acetyl esterase/lipase
VPQLLPFVTWNWEDNVTGWRSLLGDRAGMDGAHEHATAFLAQDLSKSPSTYIEVGQLDIFCDEVVAYAHRLVRAYVQTELHVIPGVPHGFELLAPDADVSRRAMADRLRALKSI